MFKQVIRSVLVWPMLAAGMAFAQADSRASSGKHEFEGGSRISLERLTPIQVDNLTVLGKVWGFLKYHHPVATSKRPTQRIGIIPDIEVRPTIEGIRAGRDEVLDAAIAEIRRE